MNNWIKRLSALALVAGLSSASAAGRWDQPVRVVDANGKTVGLLGRIATQDCAMRSFPTISGLVCIRLNWSGRQLTFDRWTNDLFESADCSGVTYGAPYYAPGTAAAVVGIAAGGKAAVLAYDFGARQVRMVRSERYWDYGTGQFRCNSLSPGDDREVEPLVQVIELESLFTPPFSLR